MKKAKVIAIANHKGGVGKTTSAINIGAKLAETGKRILLIDLDAQANLTTSLIGDADVDASIFDALAYGKPLPIIDIQNQKSIFADVGFSVGCLQIVPATLELSYLDLQLAGKTRREDALKKALLPAINQYDYILLDCPPALSLIMQMVMVVADGILIPLRGEILPYKGIKMMTDFIADLNEQLDRNVEVYGIFFTMWERTRLSQDVERALKLSYGDKVFASRTRKNIDIAEAPGALQTIYNYAKNSKGAKDYTEITNELLTKIGDE